MTRPWLVLGSLVSLAAPLTGQAAPDSAIRSILANGYRFGYEETGDGMPVVLVHGALTDYRFWRGPLETLAGAARVIAYSRRYHYPNPWRSGDPTYGFEGNAFDLVALVRALGLDRPVVVGHSWGAAVALEAVRREPGLFRALILVEPLVDSLIRDPGLRAESARRAREAFSLALSRYSDRDPAIAVRVWLDTSYGEGFWTSIGEAGQGRLRDNAHTLPSVGAPQPALSCPALGRLTLPVLLIGGSESAARQRATLDGLAGCVPGVTRVTIAGAGPLLPRSHPSEFAEAVLRFLASLPH